jgi:hypothetical protein
MKQQRRLRVGRYAAVLILLVLFLLPGHLLGQSAAPSSQVWTGITSQGERFLLVVEGGDTITLVSVGVVLHGKDYSRGHPGDCTSRHTVTQHGFLGYVVGGNFTITIENEREHFVMQGTLGEAPNGWLSFTPRQALQGVCVVGETQATWWQPGQSRPPLPPPGEASHHPPPTSVPTLPIFTATPTPRLDPLGTNWEGVPEWARPTSATDNAPTPTESSAYPEP